MISVPPRAAANAVEGAKTDAVKDTGSNAAEHRVSDRYGPIQERKDTDPERKGEGSVDAANEIFTAHQFISKDKKRNVKDDVRHIDGPTKKIIQDHAKPCNTAAQKMVRQEKRVHGNTGNASTSCNRKIALEMSIQGKSLHHFRREFSL